MILQTKSDKLGRTPFDVLPLHSTREHSPLDFARGALAGRERKRTFTKENAMNRSERELNMLSVLNATAGQRWLSTADELADLSDENFDALLLAFRMYRRAKKLEREDARMAGEGR